MPEREGAWLIYRASILTTRRPGAVSKDIIEYFNTLGYTLVKSAPTLEFARGGFFGGLISPNPASQRTEILVDMVGGGHEGETSVEVTMRVNSFGSFSFRPDHDFREAELKGLQVALEYGYIDNTLSRYAADRARWYSIAIALTGITVLAGVAAGILFLLLWSEMLFLCACSGVF